MILYIVSGYSGSFEVFSNKKEAEKLVKELATQSSVNCPSIDADILKVTIKNKKQLIKVMNQCSGGWDQLY